MTLTFDRLIKLNEAQKENKLNKTELRIVEENNALVNKNNNVIGTNVANITN